jgi:hypothetical protein
MTHEIEAIRARHEVAKQELDDERYYSGTVAAVFLTNAGKRAHADRATLLAHVDRLENLIRAMIENEPDEVALAELMHDMDARARAALAKDAPT